MSVLQDSIDPGSPDDDHEAGRIARALLCLERQRGDLDDDLLDLALSPLRERLLALQAGAPATQQLRQVTVMFVDVVGSTALGHSLEPEHMRSSPNGDLSCGNCAG